MRQYIGKDTYREVDRDREQKRHGDVGRRNGKGDREVRE